MNPSEVLESASKALAMTNEARRLLDQSDVQRATDMLARHEQHDALMRLRGSMPRATDPAAEALNANMRALVDVALEGQAREERMEALAVESVQLASRSTRAAQLGLIASALAIIATIVVALAS